MKLAARTSFLVCFAAALLAGTTAAATSEWGRRPDRRAPRFGKRCTDRGEVHRGSLDQALYRRRTFRRTAELAQASGNKALTLVLQACDNMIDTARAYARRAQEAQREPRADEHGRENQELLSHLVIAHTIICRALDRVTNSTPFEAHFDHFVGNAGDQSIGASVGVDNGKSVEYLGLGRIAGLRVRLPRSDMKDGVLEASRRLGDPIPEDLIEDPRMVIPEAVDFLVGESDRAGAYVVHVMLDQPNEPMPGLRTQLAKFAAQLEMQPHNIIVNLDTHSGHMERGPSPE